MKYKRVLVVTDNHFLFRNFKSLIKDLALPDSYFSFCCTSPTMQLAEEGLQKINIKKEYQTIIGKFDLIFSLHCKQIFPENLVRKIKCINVHPGLNPYNRGWYPQVFSIINKKPIGATIHEMDEQVDHGGILAQREVTVNPWDTSLDVYNKVVIVELDLLKENLISLLNDEHDPLLLSDEGNYNSIEDFHQLLQLNMEEKGTIGELIDKLRALTHGNFRNAYFIDKATGKKVFVKINLEINDD